MIKSLSIRFKKITFSLPVDLLDRFNKFFEKNDRNKAMAMIVEEVLKKYEKKRK